MLANERQTVDATLDKTIEDMYIYYTLTTLTSS